MTNRISTGEFQQRVRNIREQMKKRRLDVLFIYSQKRGHVPYVSGYRANYHTNSAVIVLPLERDPIMWVKYGFDLPRAQFEPASDLLNEIRLIKSAEEVSSLRDSAQLADRVAAELAKEIRQGQTERLAVVRAAQAARLEGGDCDVIISSDASRISYPPLDHEFRKGCVVNCEITVQLA